MQIPQFRRSRCFADESEVCCLKASAPNSAIPNLAAKQIAKFADDPKFNIYLRAKNPAKTTKWQQQMLSQLFEEGGVVVAIQDGMKDYERNLDFDQLVNYEKKAWENIRQNGILPHLTLSAVVIDDIKKEVILSLSTDVDGNLEEHGAVIYLLNGAWKFDSDHWYDYLSEVEDEEAERGEIDFEEEDQEKPTPQVKNDFNEVSFIVGTWVFDEAAYRALEKAEGASENEINASIVGAELERKQMEFSENLMLYWYKYSPWLKPAVNKIVRYEKRGEKIKIVYQDETEAREQTWVLTYKDDRLRDTFGCVYKRKTDG